MQILKWYSIILLSICMMGNILNLLSSKRLTGKDFYFILIIPIFIYILLI